MTSEEIAEAISEGNDPWAEEIETHRTSPLPQPPISSMVMAVRFAALLKTPSALDAITAHRAFSLLTTDGLEELKTSWSEIHRILGWLSDLNGHPDSNWRNIETPVLGEAQDGNMGQSARREADFRDAIASAVRRGAKVIAIAQSKNALPPVGRAMCQRVGAAPLPGVGRHHRVEVHQVEVGDQVRDRRALGDKILAAMQARKMRGNASYLAFTATPKGTTLEKFGTKQPDGRFKPFHLYSMKQAIEEGFILDVLTNYTTYKGYYEIQKSIEDNPLFDTAKAQKKLRAYVERSQQTINTKAEIMVENFVDNVVNAKKLRGNRRGHEPWRGLVFKGRKRL